MIPLAYIEATIPAGLSLTASRASEFCLPRIRLLDLLAPKLVRRLKPRKLHARAALIPHLGGSGAQQTSTTTGSALAGAPVTATDRMVPGGLDAR